MLQSRPNWNYISYPIREIATFLVEESIREALLSKKIEGLPQKDINLPYAITAATGHGKTFTLRMLVTVKDWSENALFELRKYSLQLFEDFRSGKLEEFDRLQKNFKPKDIQAFRLEILQNAQDLFQTQVNKYPRFENYIFVPISFNGDCGCTDDDDDLGAFYPFLARFLFTYRKDSGESWFEFSDRLTSLRRFKSKKYKRIFRQFLEIALDSCPSGKLVLLVDQFDAFAEDNAEKKADRKVLSFITTQMDRFKPRFTAVISGVTAKPLLDFSSHSKRNFIPIRLIALNPKFAEVDNALVKRAVENTNTDENDALSRLRFFQLITSCGGHGRSLFTLIDTVLPNKKEFKMSLNNDLLYDVANKCSLKYGSYVANRELVSAAVLGLKCSSEQFSSSHVVNQFNDIEEVPVVTPSIINLILNQEIPGAPSPAIETEKKAVEKFFGLVNSNNGATFEAFICHWALARKYLLHASSQGTSYIPLDKLFNMRSVRFPKHHLIKIRLPEPKKYNPDFPRAFKELPLLEQKLLEEIRSANSSNLVSLMKELTETFYKPNNPSNPGYDLLHFFETTTGEIVLVTIQAKCHFEETRLEKDLIEVNPASITFKRKSETDKFEDTAVTPKKIADSYTKTTERVTEIVNKLSEKTQKKVLHYHLVWVWRVLPPINFQKVLAMTNNATNLFLFEMSDLREMFGGTSELLLDSIAGLSSYFDIPRKEVLKLSPV
jgi:hypothetical protein